MLLWSTSEISWLSLILTLCQCQPLLSPSAAPKFRGISDTFLSFHCCVRREAQGRMLESLIRERSAKDQLVDCPRTDLAVKVVISRPNPTFCDRCYKDLHLQPLRLFPSSLIPVCRRQIGHTLSVFRRSCPSTLVPASITCTCNSSASFHRPWFWVRQCQVGHTPPRVDVWVSGYQASGALRGQQCWATLLPLIFGRILTLLKHQLQCISACAVAYSGLALQLCPWQPT